MLKKLKITRMGAAVILLLLSFTLAGYGKDDSAPKPTPISSVAAISSQAAVSSDDVADSEDMRRYCSSLF